MKDITNAEAIQELAQAIRHIGIFPLNVAGGKDDNGRYVGSLTEGVMGITESLNNIAKAIDRLACAVEVMND